MSPDHPRVRDCRVAKFSTSTDDIAPPDNIYVIITIVHSYTRKYHEFVAICIVTSVQYE